MSPNQPQTSHEPPPNQTSRPLKRDLDTTPLHFIQCPIPTNFQYQRSPYWENQYAKYLQIAKLKYVKYEEVQTLEDFMEEVEVESSDKSGFQMLMQIQKSAILPRLPPDILTKCFDVILRKSLSHVEGNKDLTPIDITIIHPNLPNGKKCYFNKVLNKINVGDIINELIELQKTNHGFLFDFKFRIQIEIREIFKKYVLGESNTLLKSIAIAFHNDLQKTNKNYMANFEDLLESEKRQEIAAQHLQRTYYIKLRQFHLGSMPAIAHLMKDYEFVVLTKGGKLIYNKGKAKTLTILEINGKFDAVL